MTNTNNLTPLNYDKSEIFTTAWKNLKETKNRSDIKWLENYQSNKLTLSFHLKAAWAKAKEANEPTKVFNLEIAYRNTSARKTAKNAGAKWNAKLKVWTLETKLSNLGSLENYIAVPNTIKETSSYANDYFQRGFDYAEEGTIGSCV